MIFYYFIEAIGIIGSYYGKPNRTIQLTNVTCNGSEITLDMCERMVLPPDEGIAEFSKTNVAGVRCGSPPPSSVALKSEHTIQNKTFIIVVALLASFLVLAFIIIIIW